MNDQDNKTAELKEDIQEGTTNTNNCDVDTDPKPRNKGIY